MTSENRRKTAFLLSELQKNVISQRPVVGLHGLYDSRINHMFDYGNRNYKKKNLRS